MSNLKIHLIERLVWLLIILQARALWKHLDSNTSPEFVQQQQVVLVSVLSFGNFSGRLSSGMDYY